LHISLQDEVLSHRLGLVPLAVDPNALAWRSGEDAAGEANTVVFKLAVRCSRAADGSMVNDKGEARARLLLLAIEKQAKGCTSPCYVDRLLGLHSHCVLAAPTCSACLMYTCCDQ
jgi:hypothetical protein